MPSYEQATSDLAEVYRVLKDRQASLSLDEAQKVWSVLSEVMRLEEEEEDEEPLLGYCWDKAWDSIDLITPDHRALLPHVLATLRDMSTVSRGRNNLRLYAINAVSCIGGDLSEVLPVLETIVQDRPRLVRSPLGRDVCSAAAYVLERAREGPDTRRPWWKLIRDWLTS
jgi:hypothetical protein